MFLWTQKDTDFENPIRQAIVTVGVSTLIWLAYVSWVVIPVTEFQYVEKNQNSTAPPKLHAISVKIGTPIAYIQKKRPDEIASLFVVWTTLKGILRLLTYTLYEINLVSLKLNDQHNSESQEPNPR